MRNVKGLYVSPDCVKVCEVDDDRGCEGYYELLGCELIEAPEFYMKLPGRAPEQSTGEYYDIICDEEAACHATIPPCTVMQRVSATEGMPWIHGPCFICKADKEGNWVSIPDDEIGELKKHIAVLDGRFVMVV